MFGTRTLARSLVAGIFIAGGATSLRKSKELAPEVEPVTDAIKDQVGFDARTEKLVQVNGAVQLAGGAAFALGILPRPVALALGATLVPTTLAAHRFWEETDAERKEMQMMGFLKNASILGGLIFAALDTGGRPSIFWSGKKAADTAIGAISSGAHSAYDVVTP